MIAPFARLSPLVFVLALSGCADRGSLGFVEYSYAQERTQAPGSLHQIYVATSRSRLGGKALDYGGDRASKLSYARFLMSVPPVHKPGKVEWPSGKPDQAKDFVTVEAEEFDAEGMRAAINAQSAQKNPEENEAVVFVHGYNTNFAESLYRLTQMVHDMKPPGIPVLYSWPSAGQTKAYVYDRDSTAIARDGLEKFLDQLAASNVSRIILVGHSMGGFLTVESLRQMAIKGNPQFRKKLAAVILISPDIDLEVFRAQVSRMQPLPDPFIIFGSKQDKALRLSARLTGKKQRLGSVAESDEFKALGVTLINVSDFKGGDSMEHMTTATSPAVISILRGVSGRFRREVSQGNKQASIASLWDESRSAAANDKKP